MIAIDPDCEPLPPEPDYDRLISIVPIWVRGCTYYWHDNAPGGSARWAKPNLPHSIILVRGDCWLANLVPGDDASGTGLLVPRVDKLRPFTLAATIICAKRRMFGLRFAPRHLRPQLFGFGTLQQAIRAHRNAG